MCKFLTFSVGLVYVLSSFSLLWSDNFNDEMSQRYVLLATLRTKTLQKEMSVTAEQGFRVLTGVRKGNEIVIIMERLTTPENSFQYRLLSTSRTSTMERELNEVGHSGFRVIPRTVLGKRSAGDKIFVVMEKAPTSSSKYKYRLLATHRTSTMEKELLEAEEAGYKMVGICSRNELMVIMEKETN
jgi:hypothetical protein